MNVEALKNRIRSDMSSLGAHLQPSCDIRVRLHNLNKERYA